MKYTKFEVMSTKAKMNFIQTELNNHGYNLAVTYKRDKPTIKALMDFQKNHGITPNGVVCENTFNKLIQKGG